MYNVISTESKPIYCWLPIEDIEKSALDQAKNLANLPFIHHHVSLMPDCHTGYGMPIGGVLATENVIIPNAVGVDIGCGMCAIQSSINEREITTNKLKQIMGLIRDSIPVGFDHHKEKQDEYFMPVILNELPIIENQYNAAVRQIGTLGGGNHFIEIQKDIDGKIWIMIHSGSRNLGFKVAKHYNDKAKELNKRWFSSVDPAWELAFLPIGERITNYYINEMKYCVDFALANRKLMMEYVKQAIYEIYPHVFFDNFINIAHNYAVLENHYGKDVWVHRKGATLAREGIIGIIPGSQGTSSYIVEGLGKKESFCSCSHGAGRLMSRKKARETLDLNTEIEKLSSKGIIHSIRNQKDLDEASSVYKNIDEVMKNQDDLVKILFELKPLAVIKG